MQRFNLTKEDVENLYDGNVNLKTVDALSIWEDIIGIENYIENIYLFSILTIVIFYFHFYKNQKVNIEVFVYYNCIMLKLCFI